MFEISVIHFHTGRSTFVRDKKNVGKKRFYEKCRKRFW